MEGSDFLDGQRQQVQVKYTPDRVPKVGDSVLADVGGSRTRWREAQVIEVSHDKKGDIGRVKLRFRGWLGLPREIWAWSFDLNYRDQGQTVGG